MSLFSADASRSALRWANVCLVVLLSLLAVAPDACLAARPGKPSPQQTKKMKEQMEWMQTEMLRVQNETTAMQQQLLTKFDENSNGKLDGAEKAKFSKYMSDVQKGKEPNPFAEIMPPGQGPKTDAKKKK